MNTENIVMEEFRNLLGNDNSMGKDYNIDLAIKVINAYMAEHKISPERYVDLCNSLAIKQKKPTVTNTYLRKFLKGHYKNPGIETLRTILSPASVKVTLEQEL